MSVRNCRQKSQDLNQWRVKVEEAKAHDGLQMEAAVVVVVIVVLVVVVMVVVIIVVVVVEDEEDFYRTPKTIWRSWEYVISFRYDGYN